MKRITALFITLIMVFCLAACGGEEQKGPSTCSDITPEQLQEILDEIETEEQANN